jgi:two-component system, OmpR family, sensor kinase
MSVARLHGRLARVGLRWRLAAWVALVVLACLGIAFVAVYSGTGTQVRAQIDSEISGDSGELAHALTASRARSADALARAAQGYVDGRPFGASSTLLFARVPGADTATNRPELFRAEAPDNGESAAEQTHENQLARRLETTGYGFSTLTLPDVGNLRLLKRSISVHVRRATMRVVVGVGEPLAPVAHAQRGVSRAFVLAGALALLVALAGAYLIGSRLSRPLRRMAAVAARVDAGDLHPRMDRSDARGEEVRVLADAFNHMLDRLTEAFAGQRAFVADASHELRTPLTVIRGQLEVLAVQDEPSAEEVRRVQTLVAAEIARVGRLVDDLLVLARSEQTRFLRTRPIELDAFVDQLWRATVVLAPRRFSLALDAAGTLVADPDRLAQALRNLLVNAIDHTDRDRGAVAMRVVSVGEDRVRFVVDDDGPGIPEPERVRVFDRFHRTDDARDRASGGAGLGLAIVDAIASAHGGWVRATESPAGGTRMTLELPGFIPAPSDRGRAHRRQTLRT